MVSEELCRLWEGVKDLKVGKFFLNVRCGDFTERKREKWAYA